MSELTEKEILWRDLELSAKLYQFYVEATLKVNLFAYGITGGILSFCLTKPRSDYTHWALILPLIMSVCLAVLFSYSSFLATNLRDDMLTTSEKLGLTPHDFSPLVFLLRLFFVLQLISSLGIAYLLWKLAA
jgi:hypothetical protein